MSINSNGEKIVKFGHQKPKTLQKIKVTQRGRFFGSRRSIVISIVNQRKRNSLKRFIARAINHTRKTTQNHSCENTREKALAAVTKLGHMTSF